MPTAFIVEKQTVMGKTFMIEFELPQQLTEEFLALIPQQRYVVNQLLAQGKLRSYALAMDRSRLWAIVSAESEFEALELISQMPLTEFTVPLVSELMFHNATDLIMQFSLN